MEDRKAFVPISYPLDEIAGKEARAFEKHTDTLLIEKWWWAYSEMYGYVRSMMAISIVWMNTLLLCRSHQQ